MIWESNLKKHNNRKRESTKIALTETKQKVQNSNILNLPATHTQNRFVSFCSKRQKCFRFLLLLNPLSPLLSSPLPHLSFSPSFKVLTWSIKTRFLLLISSRISTNDFVLVVFLRLGVDGEKKSAKEQ